MSNCKIMGWLEFLPEQVPELQAMRVEVVELMAQAGEVSGKAAAFRDQVGIELLIYQGKIEALSQSAMALDDQAAQLREQAYFAACTAEATAKKIWSPATIEKAKQTAV